MELDDLPVTHLVQPLRPGIPLPQPLQQLITIVANLPFPDASFCTFIYIISSTAPEHEPTSAMHLDAFPTLHAAHDPCSSDAAPMTSISSGRQCEQQDEREARLIPAQD